MAALREHVPVRTAELTDDLAGAMRDVEVAHLALTLRSPFDEHHAGARSGPHPLLVWLVRLARDAGVRRLVWLSSAHALGFTRDGEVSERTPVTCHHPYERALAADERWLRQRGEPEVVVLRPAQGFGPGEPVSSRLFQLVVSGRLPLPGGGTAPRTFLAGPDLGRAFHAAAVRGEAGRAYLAGGFRSSWRELLRMAATAVGLRPSVGHVLPDVAYLRAWAGVAHTGAARAGWPTPFLVELLARAHVVRDGWARRELSWRPEVEGFAAALDVGEWYRSVAVDLDASRFTVRERPALR